MSQFVKKASSKIEKLSNEEILRIFDIQAGELNIRNAILDNSFEASVMVSGSMSVLYANKTFFDLIPVHPRKKYTECHVGKVILDNEILAFIVSFIEGGENTRSEFFEIEDSMNGNKSVSCSAFRLKDQDSCLFNFRDITFFNKFKEEFRKNESLAQMTTMAAGVAHEIKNPLASISIYLQLIDKMLERNGSMTRDEAGKYLSIISEEVERINAIAVDFLFAVKPMKVSLAICNMNDIVRKTASVVDGELKEKGMDFRLNLATSLPKILADSSLMQQSILNLIRNAMQAMPSDRPDPKIIVSTYMDSDMVKLSVQDNGCGMTDDQMSKIFEPYYTTKSAGTGLGLTVLFKIMKLHGGDVGVRSTYGQGSEFTLQIPVPQTERFRIEGRPE